MALIKYDSSSGYAYEFAGFDSSTACSWTHTAGTGRDRCAVVLSNLVTGGGASTSVTATYGGVAMTAVRNTYYTGTSASIGMFYLLNPASGAQTVTVTYSSLGGGIPPKQISCGVAVYTGVNSATYESGSSGSSTSCAANANSGTLVASDFAVFGHVRSAATAFSAYNQTQRFTGATTYARILIGDNASGDQGTSSATATLSVSDVWSGTALRLRRVANNEFFA